MIFRLPVNRQMETFLPETVLNLKWIHNFPFVCIPCLIVLIWCRYYWERSMLPLREGGLLIPLLWRQQEQWKDTNGPQFHILHYQIGGSTTFGEWPARDMFSRQGSRISNFGIIFWDQFSSYCKVGKSSKREKKLNEDSWTLVNVRYWQYGILSIREILTKWNIVKMKFSGCKILTMLNVIIVSFWQCAENLKTSHPVDDEPTREKSTLRDLFGHLPRFKTNTNKETSAVGTNAMIKSDTRLT